MFFFNSVYKKQGGRELRMNRSIQAEGSFIEIKQNMGFRRYLSKGKQNILAENVLLATAPS
ncbi:transposase [Clostridium sp. AWRP]|uniref:transposase n=1 Tax=Clostridium sp. AWRP TaxID=2212991 RepID=UPI00325B2AB0